MGRSKHCSEEKRILIKKLIVEGKTYKEVQQIKEYSAKIISNALKWQKKNPQLTEENEQLLLKQIKE